MQKSGSDFMRVVLVWCFGFLFAFGVVVKSRFCVLRIVEFVVEDAEDDLVERANPRPHYRKD